MKSHNEFMEEVEEASSLPAQTKEALGPESDEDKKMYEEGSENPEHIWMRQEQDKLNDAELGADE